jgi:hypothetical protein
VKIILWLRKIALNKFSALRRTTTTWQFAIVVRVTVVASEFITDFYISLGIELGPAISNPGKYIGVAGMIHELKRSAVYAAINGFLLVQFNDCDPPLRFRSFSCLSNRDAFSCVFADFLAGTYRTICVKTCPLDTTFPDYQHPLISNLNHQQ